MKHMDIRKHVKELRKKLNTIALNNEADWKAYKKAWSELKRLDPWNEMFHYACKNYPNCDIHGCGTGR